MTIDVPCPRGGYWQPGTMVPTRDYGRAIEELPAGIVFDRLNALERYCWQVRGDR